MKSAVFVGSSMRFKLALISKGLRRQHADKFSEDGRFKLALISKGLRLLSCGGLGRGVVSSLP